MTTKAHDYTWQIALAWESYYGSAVLAGIVGDAEHQARGGYHISIEDQSSTNYSVVRPDDKAPPGTWPRDLAAAIDMSMSPADMDLCCGRLWGVWNDPTDPRRNYINAFNGWFDDGGPARRYDFVTLAITETSSDHEWHVHLEIRRKYVNVFEAVNAICSVLRGELKDQYVPGIAAIGDEMYAEYGMGLNGAPINHDAMYLQKQMLFLIEGDPRLTEHPLTVDGKYGNNTSYWVSVLLTGGDGKIVSGEWFANLNRMVTDKQIQLAGGTTINWPLKGTWTYPGNTFTIPSATFEIEITEQ